VVPGRDRTQDMGWPGIPVSISTSTNDLLTGSWNLSMSFPLAFEDLYTSLGQITSNYIGDCHGGSAYGCNGLYYDFATSNSTTDHGSSGSPIFDLETGKVIGVVTAGVDGENANITWVIMADKLNGF
jgi:S1-C subfamily serine protease